VAESRQRHFTRLDRAARHIRLLDDGNLPAFGGEVNGGCQAVVACSNYDRVVHRR
jgi:hypothetical protein